MIQSPDRGRGRDDESGFTLLEVLVALVVLGLLMVALNQGVRAGIALRQAQLNRVADTADLDATMRLLRGLLSRLPVVPGTNRLIAADTGARFAGEADRVSFVGDLPSGLGFTRLADMTLFVDRGSLVLSWTPHRHVRPLGSPEPADRTVLLSGVEGFQLAYWGAPIKDAAAAWQARWEGLAAPDLIRVRLIFGKDDRRRWPDLMAAAHR